MMPSEIKKAAVMLMRKVAQSHLQASSELPEREYYKHSQYCKGTTTRDCTCVASNMNLYFGEALDEVLPILSRKNEEVARLKAENEELKQELEACRDANVQKKKRIASLEDALKRAEGKC